MEQINGKKSDEKNKLTFVCNYQNKMLSTTETIKNLINQSISIAADFPNAKDVKTIIDAIESLSNIAAQKATTNNKI